MPLGHGQDFVVWDKASIATLHGINIYAHHPNYPAGPFSYLPFFLYLELPFRWLALHLGWSFTVLGKVPIVAADIAVAWLVADEVARRGASRRVQAAAAAAFFLNPLVLYNGAWYGRFDSLACALLLYALRLFGRHGAASRSAVGWYALAVAAKPFPGFALAGVLRAARGHRVRTAIVLIAVIGVLCLPYLDTLRPFLHDIVGYDLAKTPQALSWQTLLPRLVDREDVQLTGQILLALFGLGTLVLTTVRDLHRYVLLTMVLFLCCSKLVLDQYLTWPLPLLAITAAAGRPPHPPDCWWYSPRSACSPTRPSTPSAAHQQPSTSRSHLPARATSRSSSTTPTTTVRPRPRSEPAESGNRATSAWNANSSTHHVWRERRHIRVPAQPADRPARMAGSCGALRDRQVPQSDPSARSAEFGELVHAGRRMAAGYVCGRLLPLVVK
jgi:hypothetical protein